MVVVFLKTFCLVPHIYPFDNILKIKVSKNRYALVGVYFQLAILRL